MSNEFPPPADDTNPTHSGPAGWDAPSYGAQPPAPQPGAYGQQPGAYEQPAYGGYGSYAPAGQAGPPAGSVKPDNNLVWAILTTLLCCLPFGVVSIVFAAKVDGLWASGQYAEAEEASRKAKTWAMISAGSAVAATVLWVLFVIILGASAGSEVTVDSTPM